MDKDQEIKYFLEQVIMSKSPQYIREEAMRIRHAILDSEVSDKSYESLSFEPPSNNSDEFLKTTLLIQKLVSNTALPITDKDKLYHLKKIMEEI